MSNSVSDVLLLLLLAAVSVVAAAVSTQLSIPSSPVSLDMRDHLGLGCSLNTMWDNKSIFCPEKQFKERMWT